MIGLAFLARAIEMEKSVERNSNKRQPWHLLVVSYLLVALITFGHAWVHLTGTPTTGPVSRVMLSAAAGVTWPFYWSIDYWQRQAK